MQSKVPWCPSRSTCTSLLAMATVTVLHEAMSLSLSAQDCSAMVPAGIKQLPDDGPLLLSSPRWKCAQSQKGTLLALLPAASSSPLGMHVRPWPSAEANAMGNGADRWALRSVLGFEVDALGVVWALDQGRVHDAVPAEGDIKLVAFDSAYAGETWQDGIHFKRAFSTTEAPLETAFLNDIVVDRRREFAYISDSGVKVPSATGVADGQGAILVVDLATSNVARLLATAASTRASDTLYLEIQGRRVLQGSRMVTGADGIALGNDGETLVFCALTSHEYFWVATADLRAALAGSLASIRPEPLPARGFASDGLACTSDGMLLLTSLERSGLFQQVLVTGNTDAPSLLVADETRLVWPDTIGFDHKGGVLLVSNKLHLFLDGALNTSASAEPVDGDFNFRVARIDGLDMYSYVDGLTPLAPTPTATPLSLAGDKWSTSRILLLAVLPALAGVVLLTALTILLLRRRSRLAATPPGSPVITVYAVMENNE